jgi:hypothetical protein
MKELLERWSKVEPSQCQLAGFQIFTVAGRGICADFTYSYTGTYIYEQELVLAWLQYAVQQAIEARKWSFEMKRDCWVFEPSYEATIWTTKADGWHKSDDPAEALLSAYLMALEGEGER